MQIVSSREEFQWLLLVLMGVLLSLLPESQLWLGCLGAVLLVGIPHGSLDIYLLWFKSKKKPLHFIASICKYIFIVILGLLFWKQFPELFWAFFFFAAIYHFGGSDEHPEILASITYKSVFKTLWVLSRGTLLVFAPFTFHPQKITTYLSYAVPTSFAAKLTTIAPFLFGYASIGFLFSTIICWKKSPLYSYRWILIKHLLSLFIIIALFVVADPLLSFSLYFCCHHSLSHSFRVLNRFQTRFRTMGTFLTVLGTTLCSIPLLFWVERQFAQRTTPDGMVTASFVAIAALTFPHLIVVNDLHKNLSRRVHLWKSNLPPI